MHDAQQPKLDAPQLRTLLLTDLCDSTELVEKLGDARAAELFREHDALVLDLQQQWRGRLIDRSDGLLLLFERPIDGLGFALDYQRGLDQLGRDQKQLLRARAGLHVGEVLTWRNSDEAVQIGAKPLEVEGLAKPTAARLMALAHPGQILVSAVAESLTHRAARELGERGEQLLWKSYGRWRFKGMPTTMEIYEVGEIGRAQLRAPKSSQKAWRDIPLWRRPAALVAEVALIAAIGVGGWVATRPAPALAFAERDWVVVGDMHNLTGDPLLDDSLQQAFRISLEQSRHVNVLSDLKVRQTLKLMRKDANTSAVDRTVGTEIALRDGARALIIPSVAEVGGKLRFSAEIIDPHTQATVYALASTASSEAGLLGAVDKVSNDLRQNLGEAMEGISQSSQPLPTVGTGNLDALRAFALATKLYGRREMEEARAYFIKATELDPDFALAYLGVMRTYVSSADYGSALPYLRKAQALRASLPARDLLYLEAWSAELSDQPWQEAPRRWNMLAEMYPDYFAGLGQSAWLDFAGGDYVSAKRKASQLDVSQNPLRDVAVELRARVLLAQGDYLAAQRGFAQAEQIGGYGPSRRHAAAFAAAGEFDSANEILSKVELDETLTNGFEHMTVPLDEGRLDAAKATANRLYAAAEGAPNLVRYGLRLSALAVLASDEKVATSKRRFLPLAEEILKAAERDDVGEATDLAMMSMASVRLAQRYGQAVPASLIGELQTYSETTGYQPLLTMLAILKAEQLRLSGNARGAITLLESTQSPGRPDLFQWHVALRDALQSAGDDVRAAQENRWLLANRGLAYVEPYGALAMQGMNVVDAAQARRWKPDGAVPPPSRVAVAVR
ncbi:MAG TPA: putative peptide modification system cyclase [Stenotrophomonas sp.]|jgi:putative peptide modification system cyclase